MATWKLTLVLVEDFSKISPNTFFELLKFTDLFLNKSAKSINEFICSKLRSAMDNKLLPESSIRFSSNIIKLTSLSFSTAHLQGV